MEPAHRHTHRIGYHFILLSITGLLISCSHTQKTMDDQNIQWIKAVETGELTGELLTTSMRASPKAGFTSDGKLLIVGDTFAVKVYDLQSGLQVAMWNTNHRMGIYSMDVMPAANRVVTSSLGEVIEWEILSGRRIREYLPYTEFQGEIAATCYSPDGTLFACGGQRGFLAVWDTKTGMIVKKLRVHPTYHSIYTLAFSRDSQLLATGGTEGTIRLWEARTLKAIRAIGTKSTSVQSLAFVPGYPVLISGSGGGDYSANAQHGIHVWSLKDGSLIRKLSGHKEEVSSVVISHDGKLLASGGTDDHILIWEVGSWKLLRTLKADQGFVHALLWSSDDKLLLSIGGTRTVKFWRMK